MILNRKKLNEQGSSLLSVLVATALIGLSSAGLFQYMQNFRKTSAATVEKAHIDPLLKDLAVNNLKALLLEKGIDENGNAGANKNGICSLIKSPKLSSGVQPLKLYFSDRDTSFSDKRWKVFFPQTEWEYVNSKNCEKIDKSFSGGDSSFKKCFKYLGDYRVAPGQQIYIAAKLVILELNPESKPPISVVENLDGTEEANLLDPKKVIFQLKVTSAVTVEEAVNQDAENSGPAEVRQETYIGYFADIVWASEVGECNVQAQDGKMAIVRMSATGTGSNLENFVLNDLSFTEANACNKALIFSDRLNQGIARVGNRANDLTLATLSIYNASVACTTNTFKCPQKLRTNPELKIFDPLQFSFSATNNTSNPLKIGKIQATLIKKNGAELDGIEDHQIKDAKSSIATNYRNVYRVFSSPKASDIQIKPHQPYSLTKGSQTLSIQAEESQKWCRKICRDYQPGNKNTYIYPKVSLADASGTCTYNKDFSDQNSVSNRVQCVVCHTKMCHRYGLGTFGPYKNEKISTDSELLDGPGKDTIYGLNSEPIDSQLPECTANHSYSAKRALPRKALGVPTQNQAGCKGMALRVEGSSVNLFKNLSDRNYVAKNCAEKLPVLCFINGQFLPALENSSLKIASLREAQQICHDMGREVGKKHDLAVLFSKLYRPEVGTRDFSRIDNTLNTLDPSTSFALTDNQNNKQAKYSLINQAIRGMFLAPISFATTQYFSNKTEAHLTAALDHPHMWVGLEQDDGGMVVASPPSALVSKDHPFAIYQNYILAGDIGNRLVVLRDTSTALAASSSRPYLALAHNVRWKGLMPQDKNSRHRYVCRKNNQFYVTDAKGKLSEGPAKCWQEGRGIFTPPESGLDWAKVMLSLNENHKHYPFPDPEIRTGDRVSNSLIFEKRLKNPMAWVALKQVTHFDKIPLAEDLRLYTSDSRSLFMQPTAGTILNSGKYGISNSSFVVNQLGVVQSSEGLLGKIYGPPPEHDDTPVIISRDASNYKFVCLKKGANKEYLPYRLIGVTQSCSANEKLLNITSSSMNTDFVPHSYKYGSYWMKMMSGSSAKVILSPSNFKNRVRAYNESIPPPPPPPEPEPAEEPPAESEPAEEPPATTE